MSHGHISSFILYGHISSLILYQSHGPLFTPNFVAAQYLENQSIEFHQILYMHSYWQDLAWDCYTSFFGHFYQSNGP